MLPSAAAIDVAQSFATAAATDHYPVSAPRNLSTAKLRWEAFVSDRTGAVRSTRRCALALIFTTAPCAIISVFAVLDATVDELSRIPPLVRFALLTVVRGGDLREAGLRLEPVAVFDDEDRRVPVVLGK